MATYSRDPQVEAAVQERIRNQRAMSPSTNYDSRNYYYTSGAPVGLEPLSGYTPAQRGTALATYSGNPNFAQGQQPTVNINIPAGSQGSPENPFKTISNTKSTPIAEQNVQQIDLFKSFNEGNKANLADYLKNFGAISKQSVSDFNQESKAVNDIYDPNGLRSRLDSNLTDYTKGMKGVANRALQASLRNLSARQMGAGATGAGSYYSAQAQDAARGIDTQLLADLANRRTSQEQYLTGAGLQASGVRQRLGQNVLAGLTAPIDVRNRFLGQNIENLRGLSGIDLANTFYGLQDPSYSMPSFSFGSAPAGGGGGNYGGDFYGGDGGYGGTGGDNAMLTALQRLLQPNRGTNRPVSGSWAGPQSAQTPGMWSEEDALYGNYNAQTGLPPMEPGYTNLPVVSQPYVDPVTFGGYDSVDPASYYPTNSLPPGPPFPTPTEALYGRQPLYQPSPLSIQRSF